MDNIFDHIPALATPKLYVADELTAYLATNCEHVPDVISWWHKHRSTYPRLSRMALDYLTIPGMFSNAISSCVIIVTL
jgi:hypothetical protein